MGKIWAGRSAGKMDRAADEFNSSIRFDSRMYRQDIEGSKAHAAMLGAKGIITAQEADAIIDGLSAILDDLETSKLEVDMSCEDIHTFVEQALTDRIGEAGKKLHTARSRNDQVAVDLRMYLKEEADEVIRSTAELVYAVLEKAQEHRMSIMPGYTHMQRAQPITFGHHLMAYAMMLLRDMGRFRDARARMDSSPLGSCALAGTTFDIDRDMEAGQLGFKEVVPNSIDGVSDRDFCAELISAAAILMMHLSRFSEEVILWSTWEFGFIELDEGFTTGSSIMPQKKNPDIAELVRGKTGRVYGNLMSTLTMLKGLPLAYNKDMQEDKEAIMDSFDTVKACLEVFAPMVATMKVRTENMEMSAQAGFVNATDLADYLVRKGMPFRDAYRLAGRIVAACASDGKTLEALTLEEYRGFSKLFSPDLYKEIDLNACVRRRASKGGTSAESVEWQIARAKEMLSGFGF